MNARAWRKSTLVVLTAIIAAFAPGAGRAATTLPVVNSLVLYGDHRPAFDGTGTRIDPVASTAWDDSLVIFPNSLPDGSPSTNAPSSGEMDRVHFYGNTLSADGSAPSIVTVTVTDGAKTLSTLAIPAARSDSSTGVHKGDFSGSIQVTELGVHHVDFKADNVTPVVAPNSLPTAAADQLTYLSHLGATQLAVSASASDANGSGPGYLDASGSLPKITKYAASPFDSTPIDASGLQQTRFPPTNWCHYPALFRVSIYYNLFFTSGSTPYPVNPCTATETKLVLGSPPSQTGGLCAPWGVRATVVQLDTCTGLFLYGSRGEEPISGVATDNIPRAFGYSSEVQDIHIQILQGPDLNHAQLVPLPDADTSNILRSGPQATWSRNQRIDNLSPNWPDATPERSQTCSLSCYFFKIVVTDAWGNAVAKTSSPTTIYPF